MIRKTKPTYALFMIRLPETTTSAGFLQKATTQYVSNRAPSCPESDRDERATSDNSFFLGGCLRGTTSRCRPKPSASWRCANNITHSLIWDRGGCYVSLRELVVVLGRECSLLSTRQKGSL